MTRSLIFAIAFLMSGVTSAIDSNAQDATAQTGANPAPGANLALGQELVDGVPVGTTYTRDEYGDWQLRCALTADGKDPCQLYQLMANAAGNPVAEISLFELPTGQAAVAGATIATPLETLLTQQLTLSIDGNNSKRYPFSYCAAGGCYARLGLTFADIGSFKRGSAASVSIVRVVAPDQQVVLQLSLTGFTNGYAAMLASNAALRE